MPSDRFPEQRDELVARITELEAKDRFGTHGRNISGAITVLKEGIKWGSIVLIAYFIYLSIASLAGQTTLASIGITFIGNLTVSETVAWILAASGTIYGLNERRVRKNTVARLQPRITSLEKRLDPDRSSSTLTLRGDTNPEDL